MNFQKLVPQAGVGVDSTIKFKMGLDKFMDYSSLCRC